MSKFVLLNAHLATMAGTGYGSIHGGAIAIENGTIRWIGSTTDIPAVLRGGATEVIDCNGKLVTPGLIDCHTHLVYAGDRAREFEQRLEGLSYAEIARSGGGILSTVKATREAGGQQLYLESRYRLVQMLQQGVTTVEIKSGYGLDSANEIKMLQVAARLSNNLGVRIQKTFLAAHAVPPEYTNRKNDYIDLVCNEILPAAVEAGVVDAVDAFCEGIAFSVAQVERVFNTAVQYQLPLKLHAEQLSNLGGAKMAAEYNARSVDHLEYLVDDHVPFLKASNTVAVLLPGAFYVLRESKLPPIDALRQHQVPIAIATDCNPGSSPVNSLLLTMNMACTLFLLTPAEALAGVTVNAARALGYESTIGSLEVGKSADLVLWDVDQPAALCYHIGLNPCAAIMINGIWTQPPEFSTE